jgi:type III secretion protein F
MSKPSAPVINPNPDSTTEWLSNQFTNSVFGMYSKMMASLEAISQTDASSPGDLANFQVDMSNFTLIRNAQTNAVKSLKDIDSSTISNYR